MGALKICYREAKVSFVLSSYILSFVPFYLRDFTNKLTFSRHSLPLKDKSGLDLPRAHPMGVVPKILLLL